MMCLIGGFMLGEGVYTLSEVARFTQIHPCRAWSWFKGSAGHGHIFRSDYKPIDGDYAVSFSDLIDVLVASQFRDIHHVSMRIVRKTHNLLQKELGVKHPFCHSDLYTDGKRIFLYIAKKLNEGRLSEVISHQQFFLHVKEKLSHIEYNEITKLARLWNITEGVVINPLVSMGKPTIINTGVTTHVIANQYYANKKNTALIADLYGLNEKNVTNAVNFEKLYGCRDAA